MADDKSVQGAAEKILGLLNPKLGQSAPVLKAEPSVEPEVKKEQPQEVSNDNQSQSDEIVEEAVTTENTTEEIKEETTEQEVVEEQNLHRVKVQGQELDVTLDELKSGYSRDSDYRQKTHQLSIERKSLEGEKESLRQTYDSRINELNNAIQTADIFFKEQMGHYDLAKLYDEDPGQAAKLEFQIRQQQSKIGDLKRKANEAFQSEFNQYLKKEIKLAGEHIPEFADPVKSTEFKANAKKVLTDYGFNDKEISSLSDHRFLLVLKDAMQFKNTKSSKDLSPKKIVTAPRVIKAGVAKPNSSVRDVIQQKIGKVRKTGRMEDAQSAILQMITQKK